jgi:hypothetical protein
MTTPSTPRKAGPLLGTGAQTSWPFTFKVFAASDIAVTIANNLGVETALVLNSDYSVTLNSNQDTSPGGTVTYPISGSALPTGSRLTIFGNLPYDQPLDLPSGGNFSPLALENELDRLTMQIQQLREQVGRSLQVSVTTNADVSLPPPAASQLIGWDSTGENLENVPLSELATAIAYGTYRYDTFTGDGTTTSFALSEDPAVLANLDVSISGVVQVPGTDYSLLTGNLVFASAPSNGTAILARYGQALTSLPDSDQITFVQAGAGAATRTVQNKLRETISVKDFGAVGDGVADDTAEVQAAVNAAQYEVDLVGGIYRITSVITFAQNNMTIKNGTLLFDGVNTARLAKITGDNVTFENVVFDGNDLQPKSSLVYVDASTDRPVFNGCTFKSITARSWGTTPLNQCYALLISPYAVTNFEVVNCLFKDLIKYNDGAGTVPVVAATVGIGFIGGICFMPDDLAVPTAAQPIPTAGLVTGCTFENIQTILAAGLSIGDQADFNDADAIRTYGEPGGAEILSVHVADCIFRQCSKRAFKFRAAGSIAHDCEVYAEGMQYGMIVPIDVTSNTKVQNVKVYASVAKPVQSGVQWSIGPDAINRETLIQGLFVSHCIVGVGFFSDPTNQPLRNFVLRDIFINQASASGIRQGSPAPSTQENIVIENFQVFGSGNNCTGIVINGGLDSTGGVVMNNVKIVNGSFIVAGVNNSISNVEVEISSSSFAGETTSQPLFRVGTNGSGGYQNVNNVFINAFNLNTAFSNATRQVLNLFIGDNGVFNSIRIKVPQALAVTYAHADIYGREMNFDGLQYDGAGRIHFGTAAKLERSTILNATRMSNNGSACVEPFLYTSNAATTQVALMNITDLRPTTASSIVINAGTEFIVYNVASKTSNATIVFSGGLAKTANINTF